MTENLCGSCGTELGPSDLCPRCLLVAGEGIDASDAEILEGLLGQTIDSTYRIERVLGEGGMGAVYLATHLGTERPVALKVLAPRLMDDEEFVERFRREARAAGRLRHPNIVNVTDFGFADLASDGVLAYLVMEYLDGQSLAEYISKDYERPLTWIADIVEQIALAVDEAHRCGVIHRDLKPGNIWLVPDGRGGHLVKVLDFGLAKLRGVSETEGTVAERLGPTSEDATPTLAFPVASPVRRAAGFGAWKTAARMTRRAGLHDTLVGDPPSEADGLTRFGSVLGTPHYMSPEQCRGEKLDGRSDIYSLGVIVYEMLTGRPPFTGDVDALVTQHLNREPSEPSLLRKRLPSCIDEAVMPALAKSVASRPPTAVAFAASLTSALKTSVEKPQSILTQAVTIYGNHPGAFFGLSTFTGIIPAALGLIGGLLAFRSASGMPGRALSLLIILAGWYLGAFLNSVLLVPLVAQTLDRPAERLRLPGMLRRSLARIPAFAVANVWPTKTGAVYAACLLIFLFVGARSDVRQPEVIWWLYILWGMIGSLVRRSALTGAVSLLEGHGPRETTRRASLLMRRLHEVYKDRFSPAETFVSLLTAGGIIMAWLAVELAYRPSAGALGPDSWKTVALFLSSSVATSLLLNPVVGIANALQYLKARQLGGEDVGDIAMPTAARLKATGSLYDWMESALDAKTVVPQLACLPAAGLVALAVIVPIAVIAVGVATPLPWFIALGFLAMATFAGRTLLRRASLRVEAERISFFDLNGRHALRWDDVSLARQNEAGSVLILETPAGEMLAVGLRNYSNSEELLDYIRHQLRRRSIRLA